MNVRGVGPTVVAAIIPTHNRPKLLRAAITSVVSQELPPGATLCPVVVDDASDPPASSTLGPLADGVTILRNESPRGPAACRNQGMLAANADFVAFLDDDDHWLPGKVMHCLAAFADYPDAALVTHHAIFDMSGAVETVPSPARALAVANPVTRILHRQPPHVDGVMIPRTTWEQVRFDESFPGAAELDYFLRIALIGSIVELPVVLAVHSPSTTRESAISLERRIQGRQMLRKKHAALFDRRARAYSDVRIGHLYRRLGHSSRATGYMVRSILQQPASALPWKGLLAVSMPRHIVDRLAKQRMPATVAH